MLLLPVVVHVVFLLSKQIEQLEADCIMLGLEMTHSPERSLIIEKDGAVLLWLLF